MGFIRGACCGLALGWVFSTILGVMILAGPGDPETSERLPYVIAALIIAPSIGALLGALAVVLED